MLRVSLVAAVISGLIASGCSRGATGEVAAPSTTPSAGSRSESKPPALPSLEAAQRAFARGRLDRTSEVLAALPPSERQRHEAQLLAVDVLRTRGLYGDAIASLSEMRGESEQERIDVAWRTATCLRATGEVDAALSSLEEPAKLASAYPVWLLQGELLIEVGKRADATQPLMRLIEAYNHDHIRDTDGLGMAWVGRAAHLLRSPHDANDAFDASEQAAPGLEQTLLYRADLFLEKYDPGHAEEVLRDLFANNPNHPEGLVLMARVKLAQALDFDAARKLADRALETNPNLTDAYFLLAGLELRDMELASADRWLDRGLTVNPRELSLLSMRAAVRFLADDEAGFEQAQRRVLGLNPSYSRLYEIVGEYAEWEHRYDEIIELMKRAIAIDDQDAKAHAALGFNLIRAGDDQAGLLSLQRAFAKDPFNVRVLNTRNLYEQVIASDYETVSHGRFRMRYHRDERAILDRYVPQMLERAWTTMVEAYEFTPETPIGIELYAEREHFAIRTSGLPNTGIQGVCFGRTLAAVSPRAEPFNVGMTLWHELAHVFHIQKSKRHVPRWFTEGLAEYETIVARKEWKRERDPEWYQALRDKRLPAVGSMNRAFTHAESSADIATAYYASSQILVMLGERYGRAPLRRMLDLWASGKRTSQVVREALGITSEELDRQFFEFARRKLTRYDGQFVPRRRVGDAGEIESAAKRPGASPTAYVDLARLRLAEGEEKAARAALDAALEQNPKHADGLWLRARLDAERDPAGARATLERLVAAGRDGYDVQLALAGFEKGVAARKHLEAAHRWDPTQLEPLYKLATIAREREDIVMEIQLLERIVLLDEHGASTQRRLLELLVDAGRTDDAVVAGEAAVYADMEGMTTHVHYARALAAEGRTSDAQYEFDSALLCPARPEEEARARMYYAEFLVASGRRSAAEAERRKARALDPKVESP